MKPPQPPHPVCVLSNTLSFRSIFPFCNMSVPSSKPHNPDVLIPSLKRSVKFYHTTALNLKEERNEMEAWFVKSMVASKNEELLLTYVRENSVFKHLDDGSVVAVLSHIAPYTNKKGKTHQAHYSTNGKYLGTTTKMGEEPVGYMGWFKINDHLDKFNVVFPDDADTISDLFALK